ncbi:DUF2161 domain-containing phosphodiesterase [Pseudaestuariivita atlantica]|uniref:DUF2161 domain-containing phosphodiesterase n=1 Tax=Pseudaestuariivita atlantica TaxID=1317121 RepID=A0A0L1JPG3_9RHOB|nr:DUF2161 family putative PD-(D/E)XK-type phosphodiesterase [Pseudaestuariivita atlantica]KNG93654.1 hypothetical protein ATO11_10660 [Pseudaestuariivita atlantica]
MAQTRETELYPPIKAYLTARGFDVKGEIGAADVVACRNDETLIVELKLGFSLTLLHQAVARQRITDLVYVAVPRWKGKAGWRAFKANVGLAKRLALGVLSVAPDGSVQCHADPTTFTPRKSRPRKTALLQEFDRRRGDPTTGGSDRNGLVTAYRQEAWRCARYLSVHGATKGAVVAKGAEVPRATRMMADNHYGWFARVSPGVYDLTETGAAALQTDRAAE